MRVAVTYDNGEIFQHFGKSEQFKFFDVKGEEVVALEVVNAEGSGHSALAGFLVENAIDVLICGNIGSAAQQALDEAGIIVIPGVSGDVDEAVAALAKGELTPEEAGCGCGCGCDDEEGQGCGGHCGGGCCGGGRPAIEGPNVGKSVKVHYRGTFNDGTQFDSSYDRGTTLDFVCGAGMMIRGFDAAVAVMEVGQTVNIHLMPEEAYGPSNPDAIFTIDVAQLPGSEELQVGQRVYLANAMGQPFPVTVVGRTETTITFDANPEMAGKELNFTIELIEVQ